MVSIVMLIHPFYFHSGDITNKMCKNANIKSETKVSQEAAWFTKERKVLTAFQDKDSRAEFEKLIQEARNNGTLPTNPLLSETHSNESLGAESDEVVEIELKKGTEVDGLY